MIRKRFDRALYEANDKLAKEAVVEAIDKRKYVVEENEKKRGVDLLIYNKGEHVAYIEAEIKRVWKGKEFPYESVQIPQRKAKFTELDKPTFFVMFNADQTQYLVIKDTDLLKSPLKEVPNKYVYSGEYFFQVPIDKVHFNKLNCALKEI